MKYRTIVFQWEDSEPTPVILKEITRAMANSEKWNGLEVIGMSVRDEIAELDN